MRSLKSFSFGKGRVGILFLQRNHIRGLLLVAVVDAGRGGVEKPLDSLFPSGHEHVCIGQHAQHAESLVVFNKAHAAHVGSQLEDNLGALGRLHATVFVFEVQNQVFDPRR
jgi:hypothetical protein